MNSSKRQNDFCDIPGFDASKGERIVKALQKLWKKIQYLEQIRASEKSRSEISSSSKDEDLTLTDVQYKLLLLQLQYVRSILKKRFNSNREVFHSRINENEQEHDLPTSDRSTTISDELKQDFINEPVSQYTQTKNNYVDKNNLTERPEDLNSKSVKDQVPFDNQFMKLKHTSDESYILNRKVATSSSKPHYHLKLDDVPFILGASSTASHSVVANVQNIIAMMKSHHKVLCGSGSKSNVSKSACNTQIAEKKSDVDSTQDVTKLLNDLSRDLSQLAAKQQKLAASIDATQKKRHNLEPESIKKIQTLENKVDDPMENYRSPRHRSNSESEIKLHAEVRKMPQVKEKDIFKHGVQLKQGTRNARNQSSNLTTMDRRKLLRSLQNFKKHLSEDDISWE